MVEATEGSGMQTFRKLRGGMAFFPHTRIFGLYRFANMMALADAKIRERRGRQDAIGARELGQLLLAHRFATRSPDGHRRPD